MSVWRGPEKSLCVAPVQSTSSWLGVLSLSLRLHWFWSRRGHQNPLHPSRPSKAKVWVKGLTARLLRLHLGPWIKHQLGRRAPRLRAWGTRNCGQLTHAQSIQIVLCSQLKGHITEGDQMGYKGIKNACVRFDRHSGYCLFEMIPRRPLCPWQWLQS